MPKIDDIACAQTLKNFLTFQEDDSRRIRWHFSKSKVRSPFVEWSVTVDVDESPWKAIIVGGGDDESTLELKTAIWASD